MVPSVTSATFNGFDIKPALMPNLNVHECQRITLAWNDIRVNIYYLALFPHFLHIALD